MATYNKDGWKFQFLPWLDPLQLVLGPASLALGPTPLALGPAPACNFLYLTQKGMECRKKPFPWNTAKVARSPFRTLKTAKKAEKQFRSTRKIGFTARSSLKSMGRIPRSSGQEKQQQRCYQLGNKYKTRL